MCESKEDFASKTDKIIYYMSSLEVLLIKLVRLLEEREKKD